MNANALCVGCAVETNHPSGYCLDCLKSRLNNAYLTWAADRSPLNFEAWQSARREYIHTLYTSVEDTPAPTPTPAPEETTDELADAMDDLSDLRCTQCGSIDWSVGASGLCRTCTIQNASHIVARLRLKSLGIATAALLFLSVTSHADARHQRINPTPPAGCTVIGTTGPDEGFPVAHCADGSWVYQDLDGDGRHRNTRGRWLDASGYGYTVN
jgi:hypothetical protein